jgi:fumarate hydratase class II
MSPKPLSPKLRVIYGSSTKQAIRNFPISGWTMPQSFLRALAAIKEHAAVSNGALGVIPRDIAKAIAAAAASVKRGEHGKQFPVDVFQTGSGTSTNMNMNEVVAALASVFLERGSRSEPSREAKKDASRLAAARSKKTMKVHPNDHVNAGQSSNDVIPSALEIAAALRVRDALLPGLKRLQRALERKEKEFHSIIKTGRTHLMDAVPVRLGDEFRSYATLVGTVAGRLEAVMVPLCVLPLGGTAVGTGLNADPEFAKRVIARLAKETQLPLRQAEDELAVQSCPLALLALSVALKEVAVVLSKIAQDIRLMGSGPVSGLNELQLPELQAGSSIMPGKVNPVLCESVLQVAAWVIGADVTVTTAIAQCSNFELSTCYPLLASKLLSSIRLLANVATAFANKCISSIQANKKSIANRLARNPMLATALVSEIGYDAVTTIAKEAMESGKTVLEIALRRTKRSQKLLKKLLDPRGMV